MNRPVAIITQNNQTKILYEGTKEYHKIRGRKTSKNKIITNAKKNGYHAIWFLKFGMLVFDKNIAGFETEIVWPD